MTSRLFRPLPQKTGSGATTAHTPAKTAKRPRTHSILHTVPKRRTPRKQRWPQRKLRVIAGGLRGADIGALMAAKSAGLPTGGYIAPYMAASRPSSMLQYGLAPWSEPGPSGSKQSQLACRAMRNIEASDATVVFRIKHSRSTDRTIGACINGRWALAPGDPSPYDATGPVSVHLGEPEQPCFRPLLVVHQPDEAHLEENAAAIASFLVEHKVRVLNVAGHREYCGGGWQRRVYACMLRALQVHRALLTKDSLRKQKPQPKIQPSIEIS